MINVTRSIMPDFEKYSQAIKKLWDTRLLTNNGEYLREFEKKLEKRFQTKCVAVSNGTLALMIALELFDFPEGSEIITTPFTFVATSSSIIWQKYVPVFVDIDPETFNIDVNKLEEKITNKTVAILPVHVFGNPCNIEEIERIAKERNLKVIYDAAHCFDVYYKGKPVFSYGDASIASFHATKVFHTIEGGAIFSNNDSIIQKAKKMRNFGFNEEMEVVDKGINAKMNEFQAVMGILNLEIVEGEIKKREQRYRLYVELLKDMPIKFQKLNDGITHYNFIYMPVLFETGVIREKVYRTLKEHGYNARKYFYPSLSKVFSKAACPISEDISERILCLPLYGDLEEHHVYTICQIIKKILLEGKT